MPRERIQHGTPAYETENAADIGTPSLDVQWRRSPMGGVQIAIEMSAEQWKVNARQLEAEPDTRARAIYTTDLSRREINKMIRTLRRARDAAFGADE